MALKEYKPGQAFSGVIGRTFDVSKPAWPAPNRAREGAPNVLFIVLDDTGFGHLGCYGSPIKTPNLDALAADGLRYSNMHTTALCSPSRSCMLTGRNHHSNGLACITEGSMGYPGGNGYIPFENGMLSEILLQHGYNTYAIGKWHLTPAEATSAAGPYDRWPLGRGFERYFGFLGGDTHQYYPELVRDNTQVEPEKTPEEGYHLTPDLVEKAKAMIADAKQVAPNKPFFMYFCTGAQHAPHHVPKEWADKYKGKFDAGWDAYRELAFENQKALGIVPKSAKLSRHDPDVQDWGKLPADERRSVRADDGSVRRLPRTHRSLHRRADRVPQGDRRIRQHADHGDLRQRRQRRRRAERLGQRRQVLQQRSRRPEAEPGRDRRHRRAEVLQPLSLGLDIRRQHAVPALEARDLSWRRFRSVHRHLAEGHQGQGRGAHAVLPRHRHGADRAGCARHRAADADPRRHAVTDPGLQSQVVLRRRQGRGSCTSPSTSRCSATARSITMAGAPCVPGRVRRSPSPG